MNDHIAEITRRLDEGKLRMDAFEKSLNANTDMTREVLEIITTAKAGFKALGWLGVGVRWVGGIAAAIAAMWALGQAIMHGSLPPPK